MSTRNPAKPIIAFSRFMQGIFTYYHDRGMPVETAKARMYKETYDTCFDFFKREQDIPDHQLIITMQHTARMLNKRGADLSKKLSETKEEGQIAALRQSLLNIKETKDQIDSFISNYKGSL